MSAGFEARARLTVDVSQFVTASREATRSIGTLNTAVREATRTLQTFERAGRAAAAALRPYQTAVRETASGTRDVASAQQQMGRGVRENAQAFNTANTSAQQYATTQLTTARSMRQFAREIVDTDARVSQLRRSMEMGRNTNGQLNQSYATLQQHLRGLRQQYDGLDQGTRASVRAHMDLLSAQRAATSASREADQAVREMNRSRMEEVRLAGQSERVNQSAARTMARSLDEVRRQYLALAAVRQQSGRLDAQQQQAMRTIAQRARELRLEYQGLSSAQRAAVQSARELNSASGSAAAAMRELGLSGQSVRTGMNQAEGGLKSIDGSLWALRASVGEVEGMLRTLQQTSIRVTRSMWENFSSQEMAIAQISRVSQATALDLDNIVSSVRQMSREIPIAFNELAEIAKLGSQVGVADAALVDFTETVALFAATSEVTADETSTLMARIMQMADVPETEVMNLGSAIAYLGSNSAATDREILVTVESIATIGNQAGMSETAIVGLGGAMASLRIRPELARGAMQRTFNHLETSVRGSGQAMEMMVEMTGKTQDELIALLDSGEHSDEFFFSIIQGLNGMYENGQNLIPVLREMGVINTRDVDVLARLAANWDVLEGSVRDASGAYADANYLYAESDKIFNTLTARVQLMSNAWQEFLFEAVVAITPLITKIVEATTATIRFAQEIGAAPFVGFAAVALAAAAAIGTLGVAVATVTRGYAAWRGIILATSGLFGAKTAAVNANTASLVGNTAAMTANTGATTANSGVKAANATASTAAAAANTGLAASATAASRAMMAMALANPATTILVVLAAVVAATSAMDFFGDSVERSQRKILDAHAAHTNAAGGITALSQAVSQDTDAWRHAEIQAERSAEGYEALSFRLGRAAEDAVKYSNYRIGSSEEMSDADRRAAEAADGLASRQRELAETLGTASDGSDSASEALDRVGGAANGAGAAMAEADNSIGKINQGLSESAKAADESQYAIGLVTRQWAAMSLESAALETGLLESAEAFEVFKDSGADLNIAITKELQNAGDGAAYLQHEASKVREEFSGWDSFLHGLNEFTHNMVWDGWRPFSTGAIEAADSMDQLAENLEATSLSLEEATRKTELMEDTLVRMPDGTTATIQQLQELSGEGAEFAAVAMVMEQEISGLGISVQDLNDAFTSFIDPMGAWEQALQTANARIDEQNEALREANSELSDNELALASQYDSLLEVSGGFGLYLDELEKMSQSQMEWSQNLMRIADEVPPHVLAGLAEMGVDGAEIVAGLVDASDDEVARFVELWDQGAGDVSSTFTIMFSDFLTQAASSGNTAGVDFVMGLMDEVAQGDISFRDAVNQMTEYAEEEFQNADTENEPNLELTKVLKDLAELIERIETDTQNADAVTTPTLSTGGFWDSLVSFWDRVKGWWSRNARLTVNPSVSTGPAGQYGSQGRKDGGWVSGPGGPREDKIPMWLSDNEYVVNARSAREFGPLLEWINSQHGRGSNQMVVPNFVPNDILSLPRRPVPSMRTMAPESLHRSQNTYRAPNTPAMVVNVTNNYPQAEPTSVTVNRALATGAALNGVV